MTGIINLTPHDIVIVDVEGNEIVIPRSGFVARVTEKIVETGEMDVDGHKVKLGRKELGDIDTETLNRVKEEIKKGNKVLVSLAFAQKLKDYLTKDELENVLIVVNVVRDEQGRIRGADLIGKASEL